MYKEEILEQITRCKDMQNKCRIELNNRAKMVHRSTELQFIYIGSSRKSIRGTFKGGTY